MSTNCGMSKGCVLGLAIGLSVLVVGSTAQASSEPNVSYQFSDVEGAWSWSQDPWFGDFTIQKDGDSYSGALNDVFEGTYGDKVVDVGLWDNHLNFTRDGRYGIQFWDGALTEEDGILKIVEGRWLKPEGDTGPFTAEKIYSMPVNLGLNINSIGNEDSPDISADGMTLYFDAYSRRGGSGGWDIWMSEANTPHQNFAPAVPFAVPVNSAYDDCAPCISDDGLTFYFASNRPGGSGDFDIWMIARTTVTDPWTQPVNLGPVVNSPYGDSHPSISADGLTLYFDSRRPPDVNSSGGSDIYMTHRATLNDPWEKPEPVVAVNTPGDEYSPDISSDGLSLYYDSPLAKRDLWVAKRTDPNEPWQQGTHLGMPFSSGQVDTDPTLSADGSMLYFVSDRPNGRGSFDIWQVEIKKKQK
jgi:hypothetical protein